MNEKMFDPMQFYSSYPSKVIGRPGYPARAAFKSTLLFDLFGRHLFGGINKITSYADIGGCFGFGANAMGFHIAKQQGALPRIMVFEIVSGFVDVGKVIFPHIEFVETEFHKWNGDIRVFDLITLFDVVEHVVDIESFLQNVAAHSKYVILKTPMETSGEWRKTKPSENVGENHPDGHINFFTPEIYEKLLKKCGLDIIESRLLPTIVPTGAIMALLPENYEDNDASKTFRMKLRCIPYAKNLLHRMVVRCIPFQLARKIFGGGEHICLCRSLLFK